MNRRRSLSALMATALALALGATSALGAQPVGGKGKIGTFSIPDEPTAPGVSCTYDAAIGMGNDLDVMQTSKGLRVFARDRRAGTRDAQTVGVRFLFQRSVEEGNSSNAWVTANRTKMIKKTAYDDKPARFGGRSWTVPFDENYHYRTLVLIKWFRPGSTSKGQGSTRQRYEWYQVLYNGPLMVEQDRCLPNP
jgi:hypothetical protein